MGDFVVGVPDGPGLFELVHGDEGSDEYWDPEEETWYGNGEEEDGPGETEDEAVEDSGRWEGFADPVVFYTKFDKFVLILLWTIIV